VTSVGDDGLGDQGDLNARCVHLVICRAFVEIEYPRASKRHRGRGQPSHLIGARRPGSVSAFGVFRGRFHSGGPIEPESPTVRATLLQHAEARVQMLSA
jgi:hypothetical protein